MMFGQTFALHDLIVIGILIVLEGLLSLDNALVLGLLARQLPRALQTKALTYGLVGAIAFRIIAVIMAAALLRWHTAKLLGGAYLIYVAVKHLVFQREGPRHVFDPEQSETSSDSFWYTVAAIELTDVAFAVDSILAAIALIGNPPRHHDGTIPAVHPKLWVVIVGGIAGVILMRFAAVLFIRLLERFPRFEMSAYLLVLVIGVKMFLDWAFNQAGAPPSLDFHNIHEPAFWLFWGSMAACAGFGFVPVKTADSLPN
ncbi:MAG: hypothetical protein JO353_02850 [Phycisphaerae bacterium]|nr:hypothetical protein [Phycisphaerae bacterium]